MIITICAIHIGTAVVITNDSNNLLISYIKLLINTCGFCIITKIQYFIGFVINDIDLLKFCWKIKIILDIS